jgi:hypothetical protein
MGKPAHNLYTVAVGQGLRIVEYLRNQLLAEGRGGAAKFYKTAEIAANISEANTAITRVLMNLSRNGVIHTKMGPEGGYQITPEQLTKHTVLDLIYYLGQDVPEPVGDDAFERLKGRTYDFLNIPLEDFLK